MLIHPPPPFRYRLILKPSFIGSEGGLHQSFNDRIFTHRDEFEARTWTSVSMVKVGQGRKRGPRAHTGCRLLIRGAAEIRGVNVPREGGTAIPESPAITGSLSERGLY